MTLLGCSRKTNVCSRKKMSSRPYMLSDVCELTGLWGPNLFSYRKGISSFTMVLVMRRSMYKILQRE